MKKQMTALVLGAALSLSAATAVPFETSMNGGWKQVEPNTFEVKNKGAWHASLVLKAGVKPGSCYRVSWDASSRKGQGATSYGSAAWPAQLRDERRIRLCRCRRKRNCRT